MKRASLLLLWLALAAGLAAAYAFGARAGAMRTADWKEPYWLYGLALLPLLLYRTTYGADARSARLRLGRVASLLDGPRGFRAHLVDLPGALRTVGVGFCILALARPVSLLSPAVSEEQGIDLVVALDLSGSMQAVMENLPEELERFVGKMPAGTLPTRLDAAKAVLRDFIGHRKSDRIGVVVFGKSAYVVAPPTLDYQLLDTLVSRMELSLIDPNGTAIGDALGTSVARLRRSSAKSKAIVLLTDGDNKGGTIAPEYAAHLANLVGARIHTIQIGEGETAKVRAGTTLFGQPRYELVAYPVNPELLAKLAKDTGGTMHVAADAKSLRDSLHEVLDQLEKTEFEAAHASYEDLFPYAVVPGVLLIALEALLAVGLLRRFP
ncbi:MAG TPA: VWA domain-containing protein [Polyangiaceae bacterium]|nr:VWA domain-containing protein [Polyangiaceae bacterium]